jgi:hypothetical protein
VNFHAEFCIPETVINKEITKKLTGSSTDSDNKQIIFFFFSLLLLLLLLFLLLLLLSLLLFDIDVSCHRPFLPGTSLEPAVITTAQASSFTLQYFPYYV